MDSAGVGVGAVTPWHLLGVVIALLVCYALGVLTGYALGRLRRRSAKDPRP